MKRIGQISAVTLAAALVWLASCRDAPRDNLFDPGAEILQVLVLSPPDSSSFFSGETIEFQVIARTGYSDQQAGSGYLWRSDISGELSESPEFSKSNLPVGTHRITVFVEDSLEGQGSAVITLTVKEMAELAVRITNPPGDTAFIAGGYITPAVEEHLPEGIMVAGRAWYFGEGSGISDAVNATPDTVVWEIPGTFSMSYQIVETFGRTASDTVVVTVLSTSEPPVVKIVSPENDTTIAMGESLFLEALDLDPAAGIAGRLWEYPQGSGLEKIQDSVTAPGLRQFPNPGVFKLIYRVRDFHGAEGLDSVTVTVIDPNPNQPPIADITFPQHYTTSFQGVSVEFSATDSDPDPDDWIATRTWSWGDGSGIVYDPSVDSTRSPGSKTFLEVGTFMVIYTVTDNRGAVGRDSVGIAVEANQLPVAFISSMSDDTTITAGDSVPLEGTSVDPGGTVASTQWSYRFDSGPLTPVDPGDPPAFLVLDQEGVYLVYFTVTDDAGASVSDSTSVVTGPKPFNYPPEAWIISPSRDTIVVAWSRISFVGGDSDADLDGGVVSRHWSNGLLEDFDPAVDTTAATGPKLFNVPGTFRILYTVTDNRGDSTSAWRIVTVLFNNHPNADIISPDGDVTITVGDSVTFLAVDSDPGGQVVSRLWTYGNSGLQPDTTATPGNRIFSSEGVFKIIYTVTDDLDISWSDTVTVTVITP